MSPTPQVSKLKIGWIAPCVGIGGADAYMLGLIRNAQNVYHKGIAIADATSVQQADWVYRYLGNSCEIHQIRHNTPQFPGWNYHDTMAHAIYGATEDCNIIVSWGVRLESCMFALDKPVIEIAQNEDQFAAEIVKSNKDYVNYRVAVSEAAAKIFGNETVDSIIYNGIDPSRCCPRYGRETCREMWGFKDRKVILFLGRMVQEKNPGMLIAALSRLPEEYCVLYVGRGYDQESLLKEAQRHVGGNRVFFARPQFHIGDVLAASDVYVLPSDFEGLPLALLEAWMAGTPAVCTDFSAVGELHNKFGNMCTVVPRKCSPEKLAEAIYAARLENPSTVEMCARAQNVVWNNFTLPTIVAQWEELFSNLYYRWFAERSRMQVYKVQDPEPLTTSKAHLRMVDTSHESISKWDRIRNVN